MSWRFSAKGRPLKARFFFLPLVFTVVLVAGCGGGGSASLASDDVATVGDQHIKKGSFTQLMDQACRSFKAQGRKCPKAGSTDYSTIKNQAITLLVQQAEREEKAHDMGVKVDDKAVDKRLEQIKKQYFGGSEKRYKQQLKKQGLSDEQVRRDIRAQLISEAVFKKVTDDVKVSSSAVHDYYVQHPQLYAQQQSRDVRHILVKTKPLADRIYTELKGGADFAKLAKKYSNDPGSKSQGGKLTVSKGQTVPPFDKVAFSLKTNELSKPVKTQYGWHIIQALSAIKPRKTTPEKQVSDSIKQQLIQQKKNEAMTSWVNGLTKDFCKGDKVKYQVGYKPNPDPCAQATSTKTDTSQ
jgi:parvulin-like peptidyl-prolyl isomerase